MVQGINVSNGYPVSNSGLNQENIQNTLAKSKETVTTNIESNSAVKTAAGATSDPDVMQKTVLLLPPIILLNRYIDKLIGASDNKNIFNKFANLGDRISHFLHLDNVISEENGKSISKFLKENRFTKYFTSEYKANAKSSFAKVTSLKDKYAQELASKLTDLKYDYSFSTVFKPGFVSLSPETLKFFENIGPLKTVVTDDYLKSVLAALDDMTPAASETNKKLITSLQEKITTFIDKPGTSTKGLADDIASVFSKVTKETAAGADVQFSDNVKKVLSSLSGSSTVKKFSAEELLKTTDDLINNGVNNIKKGSIIKEPVNLSTMKNKLKAADFKIGKTGLGKIFAQSAVKMKDLLTFGGGFLGLAFTANALVQTIKATKEAPEGEKLSTFMHVLSEQYIGMLLFTPSINALYKAGGNKYRGMTIEGREALKELVKNTNANKNLTKEGLKVAKLQRKLLLNGVSKDKVAQLAGKTLVEAKNIAKTLKKEGTKLKFWEKPLKALGGLLDTGLDSFKATGTLGKIGNKIKGFAGGFGRLLLIMMVIQPFIQKPITNLCHKIFGKPKTYLEKNNPELSSDDKQKNNLSSPSDNNPTVGAETDTTETNLLNRLSVQNNNIQSSDVVSPQPAAAAKLQTPYNAQPLKPEKSDEIAALNLFNRDKKDERYIPSIEVDNTYAQQDEKALNEQVEGIIKNTDSVIKNVKKYI